MSADAKACPKCGKPRGRPAWNGPVVLVAVLLVLRRSVRGRARHPRGVVHPIHLSEMTSHLLVPHHLEAHGRAYLLRAGVYLHLRQDGAGFTAYLPELPLIASGATRSEAIRAYGEAFDAAWLRLVEGNAVGDMELREALVAVVLPESEAPPDDMIFEGEPGYRGRGGYEF